jgi:hypothetical protein
VSDEASIDLDLEGVADTLRDLGYDIEPAQPGEPRGATVVARRDLGDRAIVLVLDAGGRLRIDLTWTVGEWASRDELAGVPLRVVDTVARSTNLVGRIERPEDVGAVVAALGGIADWAAPARRDRMPGAEFVPPP